MSNRLALLVAALLGLVAAFAVHLHIQKRQAQEAARTNPTPIVVVGDDVRQGEELRLTRGPEGMIAYKAIPQDKVLTGMITPDDINRYSGWTITESLDRGSPLLRQFLSPPTERAGQSASYVPEGMRAVTLSVDMITGGAGLLRPGDHVDIVATFDLGRGGRGDGGATGTKTVWIEQNARVVALDNVTEASYDNRRARRGGYRSVTLAVEPFNALRLINAAEQGKVQLLLRNRLDVSTEKQFVTTEDGQEVPVGVDVPQYELPEVADHTKVYPVPRPGGGNQP
jgi:pilus assembly protein CpaB